MVGVPGKFKGCETCRLRRVKCDNTRPFCKKCLDTGRECQGYEREPVFIIGTIEDGGRCSSHPPRVVKTKKAKASSSKNEQPEKLELAPTEPLQPAWDDLISLSSDGTIYQVQIAALYTSLQMVGRQNDEESQNKFALSFQPYMPANPRPLPNEEEFQLRSQCMVHLSPPDDDQGQSSEAATTTDSLYLFLYEHNSSLIFNDLPPWSDPAVQTSSVRQLGPEQFRVFPAHHFFVRVYRHSAICAALLNRKSTFLSGAEWLTAPWEFHPKSWLDKLFDVIVLLPSIFSRADRILPHDPTLARRLMAQDLLGNCLHVERLFDEWHFAVNPALLDLTQPATYWIEDPEGTDSQIPFADIFAFRDSVTAIMFIYYWTSLALFYPCVEKVYDAIFQPVVDAFPQIFPNLPPNLQINPLKYSAKEVRELAANVCRGLDFALTATGQPDLLIFPLFVVEEFYREINTSSGDGALELMWCEAFKGRLAIRGQDITDVVQSRKWIDVVQY